MYNQQRGPTWHRDAKWLSGILLALTLAIAVLLVSLAQLTASGRAVPLLERVLQVTLLPNGEAHAPLAVRQGSDYQPGEPLELLPGVAVHVDATELPGFDSRAGLDRIAGVLAERVLTDGVDAARQLVTDPVFREQLDRALTSQVPVTVEAELSSALMPAGLDNGSRLADWRLQAERNPGEMVQPIVGVFVYLSPGTLEPLSPREIGQRVVAELAGVVLAEGLPATLDLVTNQNLRTRLAEAVQGPARAGLHHLFVTLLLDREASLAERLEQAQAALAGTEEADPALFGVVTAAELAGRSTTEANELVLARLAERAWRGGSAALLASVTEERDALRLEAATGLVDALSERAQGRYERLAWILGGVAGLLLVLLMVFSHGWGRLFNTGFALVAAAAAGSALSFWLLDRLERASGAEAPASLAAEGAFGHLAGLLAYLAAGLPRDVPLLLARNHLAVLALGAALVLLGLLVRLVRTLRPRRRSLL